MLTKIKQIEISIEFTEFCNLRCHYCCQDYNHRSKEVISYTSFTLMMNTFFKKLYDFQRKNNVLINLDISLLGGELSVLYEQNNYFKYFLFLKQLLYKYQLNGKFILLTNFTGKLDFFIQLIEMKSDRLEIEIHITLHETYYTSSSKIKNAFSKLKSLENSNIDITIAFLVSDSPAFINMKKLFDEENLINNLSKNISINYDKLLKIGQNSTGEFGNNFSDDYDGVPRYCNSTQLEFNFKQLTIIDQCRNTRTNFLSWQVPDKFIYCDKVCIYPSLHENFTQFSEKEFLNHGIK